MSTPAWQRPFEIIRSGFRSCGQYFRAWRELRRLPARRADCEKRLAAACTEIGTAAGESRTGADLPEFAALVTARDGVERAAELLGEKLSVWQNSHASSSEETAAADAALARAIETARAATADAAAAQHDHQAAQSRLAAAEDERSQIQTRLNALPATSDFGEPTEEWQARITAGEVAEKEQGAALSAAQQSERDTAAAAKAAGSTAEKAVRSWESAKAKLEKTLNSALGSVAPDRDNIILAAQAELDAATLRNDETIAQAQAQYRSLTDASSVARSHREAREAELAAIRLRLAEARNVLTSRTLRTRVAELEGQKPEALAALEAAAVAAGEKNAASQSASEAQARAQAASDDAKSRGQAAVAAGKAAHDEAAAAANTASEALQSARLVLGRALFKEGIRPESAADAFVRAEACTAELAQLEGESLSRHAEMQTARSPAGKTVLGTAAALCALVVTILLLTKCGSSAPPAKEAGSKTSSPAK